MNRQFIEQFIAKHEGRRSKVYSDSRGILTIGIGWNLEDKQSADICEHFGLNLDKLKSGEQCLSDEQIDQVYDYQVTQTISSASGLLVGFMAMPDNVQAVVVDMIFNLGLPRFSKFRDTIAALNRGGWKQAAIDAGQSLWAKQVPNRAKEDIALLEAA